VRARNQCAALQRRRISVLEKQIPAEDSAGIFSIGWAVAREVALECNHRFLPKSLAAR
jgi:hypothetical protein